MLEKMEKCRAGIFMPVLNSHRYLIEAVESILNQTYKEFVLYIVDGGSTDLTLQIARYFEKNDQRVCVVEARGKNPIQRFNELLSSFGHEFFFIAHSDDIQIVDRLELQISTFDDDPEIVAVGGDTFYFRHDVHCSTGSYSGIAKYPKDFQAIGMDLIFWWCHANPTLAFRVKPVREAKIFMSESFKFSSDYLFYFNIQKLGKTKNIDKQLIFYRHHEFSDGSGNRSEVESEVRSIRKLILSEIGLTDVLSEVELNLILNLKTEKNAVTTCPDSLDDYRVVFNKIYKYFKINNMPNCVSLDRLLNQKIKQIRKIKHPSRNKILIGAKKCISCILKTDNGDCAC